MNKNGCGYAIIYFIMKTLLYGGIIKLAFWLIGLTGVITLYANYWQCCLIAVALTLIGIVLT